MSNSQGIELTVALLPVAHVIATHCWRTVDSGHHSKDAVCQRKIRCSVKTCIKLSLGIVCTQREIFLGSFMYTRPHTGSCCGLFSVSEKYTAFSIVPLRSAFSAVSSKVLVMGFSKHTSPCSSPPSSLPRVLTPTLIVSPETLGLSCCYFAKKFSLSRLIILELCDKPKRNFLPPFWGGWISN